MKFDVNKSVSLAGFRAGDAVRFQVVVVSDTLEVIALEKRP